MTDQLQLVPCVPDPFGQFPQLWSIWPEPYASQAAEASAEDWKCVAAPVWLVMYGTEVIGITGWFFLEDDAGAPEYENVYLRWTGVIPEYRRKGLTTQILGIVIDSLRAQISAGLPYKQLVEQVPDNEYGKESVAPFFESLGWTNVGVEDYWGKPWINYVKAIALAIKEEGQ